MEEENKCVDKVDVEYKYFDKIDVDYIRLQRNGFTNHEEYNTIIKPKNDKYKDCNLDNIDNASVKYKGIYDTIYHKIGVDLKIYDNLIWHKFFNEEYNGVKGVRTANEICLFYKELMHLLGIDDDELYVNFTTYIQDFGYKGMLDKDNNDSNQSTNPTYLSNPNERLALQTSLSQEQLKELFNKLVEKRYIEASENTFLACFGHYAGESYNQTIKWLKKLVEFEILLKNIVTKENNSNNSIPGLPRNKIEKWFVDKKNKVIKAQKKITNDESSYQIYSLLQELSTL